MRRLVRWLPAVVAPVVVVGTALGAGVIVPALANASANSPSSGVQSSSTQTTKTPTAAEVLALMAKARDAHYSASVQQTSDLGLPQLPSGAMGGIASQASSTLELLTASHDARVYVDGPTRQRLQVLDSMAERDVVRNGTSVWTWDSAKDEATHLTTPTRSDARKATETATPQDLADQVIARAEKDSTLTVSAGSQAGHAVWRLTVAPKASGSLVSKAVLSIDAKTGVPLATEIDAVGQTTPAVSVQVTTIDYRVPAAANFTFTPPKGAKVTEKTLPAHASHPDSVAQGAFEGPTVVGSGWTAIAEVPASALGSGTAGMSSSQTKLLDELSQPVDGGRGLQTSLFSVLLTSGGNVYVGAVPLSALESAAK